MNTDSKKYIYTFLTVIFIVLSFAIISFVGMRKNSSFSDIKPDLTPTPSPVVVRKIPVKIIPENYEWKAGSTQKISIVFDGTTPSPTALTLNISFDNSTLQITKAEAGDLWSKSNILENVIDNKGGKASLSIGEEFGAETTTGVTLANITFKVVNEAKLKSSTIALDADSAIAKVGQNELISIVGQPLVVNLID